MKSLKWKSGSSGGFSVALEPSLRSARGDRGEAQELMDRTDVPSTDEPFVQLESRSAADSFASVRRRTRARNPGLPVPGLLGLLEFSETTDGLLFGAGGVFSLNAAFDAVRSVLERVRRSLWSKAALYE